VLLEWFGFGAGPWPGFPFYEKAAEELLLGYPTTEIVAAIQSSSIGPAQTEGAARQRQPQELVAQVLRIVGAAILTAAGLVPEGNTGGGNVSAFRRLPVPPELAAIIASVRSG
jgi:hypothetical protein